MNPRFRQIFALLILLLSGISSIQAEETKDYLYYRDVVVPPYQSLREFFDMPDRLGHYEVIFISEAIGPLTFRVESVSEDEDILIRQSRSFKVGGHEFHQQFFNSEGLLNLRVEIANSNPVVVAKVSVIIVEITNIQQ